MVEEGRPSGADQQPLSLQPAARSARLAQGLPGGERGRGGATSVPRHLFTGAVSTGLSCPAPAYMAKLQAYFLPFLNQDLLQYSVKYFLTARLDTIWKSRIVRTTFGLNECFEQQIGGTMQMEDDDNREIFKPCCSSYCVFFVQINFMKEKF